jgi:hypothetical protein
MKLNEYFRDAKGIGVLATANSAGEVDLAVYAKPHFEDEETVVFIMADRLLHRHLQSNPHAAYLFKEDGEKYVGRRLFLSKIKEEDDDERINSIMKQYYSEWYETYKDVRKYLVYFKIDRSLPLVGDKD